MAKPKRKPVPNSIAVQKKQDGPNKKALIWSASLIVLIIIAMSVLLIVNG
jgi:hypothetical protein